MGRQEVVYFFLTLCSFLTFAFFITYLKLLYIDEDYQHSYLISDHVDIRDRSSIVGKKDFQVIDDITCINPIYMESLNENHERATTGNSKPNIFDVNTPGFKHFSTDGEYYMTESSTGPVFPVNILEFKELSLYENRQSFKKEVSEQIQETKDFFKDLLLIMGLKPVFRETKTDTTAESLQTLQDNPSEKMDVSQDENHQGLMTTDSPWINDQKTEEDLAWKYSEFCKWAGTAINICESVGQQVNGMEYPKRLRIRRATNLENYGIANDYTSEDEPRNCNVPKDLNTTEILCTFRPTTAICKSYCMHGHTFNEGIVRTHTCTEKYGKWNQPFEECKPFINCGVKLNTGGQLKCISHHIKVPTSCFISCDWDDIDKGAKPDEYVCKIDGSWNPPLPYCAELKDVTLATAPKIKKHENLTYPF